MKLKLEIKPEDNKFIARSKKTCLNKFRYTRQEKLNEFNNIAGFLISLNRLDEAIDMCHKAIEIDPSFGNPYNDIGAYMIELGRYEEALPWLQKATQATRYQSPQLPHLNLGRVHEANGRFRSALESYNAALELDPMFLPGEWAKAALLGKMN